MYWVITFFKCLKACFSYQPSLKYFFIHILPIFGVMDRWSTVPVCRFPAPDVLVIVTDGAGFPEASQGISASPPVVT